MNATEQIKQITNMIKEMNKVIIETGMLDTGHEGDRRAMEGVAAVVAAGHQRILQLMEQIKEEHTFSPENSFVWFAVPIHPVPTPRPVSARYPNARPASADAYLGEHIVVCDGCMGIVKVLRTEGNTRIVGVAHEDRNDHGLHWFAVPIHPEPEPDAEPVAVGDGLLDWPAANGWDAADTDTPQ